MSEIRVVNVRGLKGEARKGVCYVGRDWAGWPATIWGNPYRVGWGGLELHEALTRYRKYAESLPSNLWDVLWEACEHGAKPLGCWCVNAEHGDGQPVVCHAQILAELLHERFCK